MNTITVRIREIFNKTGDSQSQLARVLNVSPAYVWKLMNKDDANPSNRLIEDICEKIMISGKKINENWLRTGEGDMFLTLDRKEEIAQLTADLFKSEKDSFKSRLIMSLSRLSEEELAVLEKISADLAREKD